jgi:hypothetical protein
MHSIAYDYAPSSFAGVWVTNANRDPNFNLRNTNDFYLIQPRTETFKKSTLYALPLTCNELAPEIKFQHNRITFKWAWALVKTVVSTTIQLSLVGLTYCIILYHILYWLGRYLRPNRFRFSTAISDALSIVYNICPSSHDPFHAICCNPNLTYFSHFNYYSIKSV